MSDPAWTRPVPAPPPGPAVSRFLLAAVAVGLAGLLAGVATWAGPAPDPYFVPLWVTQYQSPALPPAAAAAADREAVLSANFFRRGPDAYASQEAAPLVRELAALATLPANERVVVYLSGYAVPQPGGEVGVYPADADPARGGDALPLSDLLRRLAAGPRQTLVLCDLAEPTGDARAGGLRADCAARVPALLTAADPAGRLAVVWCCGPGQTAQPAPADGRTAFGRFVERGLRGEARAFNHPDHPADRRVSAHELARYLADRVDRWAVANRGVRQTPTLYGDAPDFDLVATGPGADSPAADPPAPPAWLAAAWADLDRRRADGTLGDSPRLFQRLAAAVRRADASWRGPAGDRAAEELRFATARVDEESRLARQAVPAAGRPLSLAAAEAAGERPDLALRQAAAKLIADAQAIADPAARAKLAAGFASKAPLFAVEDAVLAAAEAAGVGRPDTLQLLDGVVREHGGPASAEARFLARLAAAARQVPADRWSADAARAGLAAVRRAERAAVRWAAFPWVGGVLEEAVQARVEGEQLVGLWADVPADAIADRFRRAAARADAALGFADTLAGARRAADESLVALANAARLLDEFPDREPLWHDWLAATSELLPDLAPPATPLAPEQLPVRQDDLARRAERVRQAKESFAGGALVADLVARAGRPDAGPAAVRQAEAALAALDLQAPQRAALADARLALARRLDDTFAAELPADSPAAARVAEATRAARRGRCELALLRLAGLPAADLAALGGVPPANDPDSPAWDRFADGLRRAWGVDGVLAKAPPGSLDVLAAVFPGADPAVRLDAPPGGPRTAPRRAAMTAYLGWLADRYRFAARAGLDPELHEAALADLGPAAASPAAEPLTVRGPDRPVPVPGEATLAVSGPAAVVRVLPRDGVRATVDGPRVRLAADGSPPAGPVGVVAECRAGGRSVFVRLPVAFGPAAPPLDLLVSAPGEPADLGDAVRLRPSEAAQPLRVLVQNPTADPRAVAVRLAGPVTAEAKATAAPTATTAVPLAAGPPAAPPVDLPTTLTLTLATDDKLPPATRERTVRFDVADPLEYLEVADAGFQPGRPTNKLRVALRARRPLGPAPCTAELVLDPAAVPGYGGAKVARLKGVVPPDGSPLVLEADGLALAPDAAEGGEVSLTLDGVPEAVRLRVLFARDGPPTVPALELSPRVRLDLLPPPAPGQSVRFRAAGDRGPAGSRLVVQLLRPAAGEPVADREQTLPGPRRRQATFAATAGGLAVTPSVQDWDVTWETPQLVGRRTLLARLLAADGTELARRERTVELDTTPPAGVALIGLPAKAKAGEPLRVRAEAADRESGVAGVRFFLGAPVKDRPPPGAAVADGAAVSPGVWAATLTPPAGRTGPLDVGVLVENRAGQTTVATQPVELVTELPAEPAKLVVTVLEADRPQPGLTVTLSPGKGKGEAKTATTAADGTATFADLAPGKYTVSTSKVATRRTARQPVTVEAGKTATLTLELSL